MATHFNNHKLSDKDAWKIQPEDIGGFGIGFIENASKNTAQ